ncbi:MAG: SAV_6107 family HEPN domain-containing protein [Planctomycetota bacterium]|nr:SAV_6107 family HEPN domain-containing protein [Planctomycetota bacterium]
MTWQQLLPNGRAQAHETSKQELDDLREVIERDLSNAAIPALSADRRFATAYNAVLQLAKMAIACAGYRVSARSGHHQTTFVALKLAIGNPVINLAGYFEICRRKRNMVDYDSAHVVTETEATELLNEADRFRQLVEDLIAQNYPQLS